MRDFELVKNRLNAREKEAMMNLEEARRIFYDTTISIGELNGKYYWFAIMGEDRDFDNVEDAVDGAMEYLKSGGY